MVVGAMGVGRVGWVPTQGGGRSERERESPGDGGAGYRDDEAGGGGLGGVGLAGGADDALRLGPAPWRRRAVRRGLRELVGVPEQPGDARVRVPEEGALADGGEGDKLGRDRDSLRPPGPVKQDITLAELFCLFS